MKLRKTKVDNSCPQCGEAAAEWVCKVCGEKACTNCATSEWAQDCCTSEMVRIEYDDSRPDWSSVRDER